MSEFITKIKSELKTVGNTLREGHLKTGDIRKMSARLFRDIKGKPKEYVFEICDELLQQYDWPMGVIAYDFAYRVRGQYDLATFDIFEKWLEQYVRGWGDCDDFCTHAFGELICQNTELIAGIIPWTRRDEFWMRRAAAVILIPSIWQDKYKETHPLQVSDLLMQDEHDLVRKGYGWMLKVLSTKEPVMVFDYLMKNKAVMPRVSFRYALEKMNSEDKRVLMA